MRPIFLLLFAVTVFTHGKIVDNGLHPKRGLNTAQLVHINYTLNRAPRPY